MVQRLQAVAPRCVQVTLHVRRHVTPCVQRERRCFAWHAEWDTALLCSGCSDKLAGMHGMSRPPACLKAGC